MINTPLVSFCLLSYNQKDYIREAVLSALKQDYVNLEIIISDDNSSDTTYNIIERTIEDNPTNHKIILNKNISNLGLIKHLNYVLENLVHGEYVLLMGGDDISAHNRTLWTMEYFRKYPNIGGLVFSYKIINASGQYIRTVQCRKDQIFTTSSCRWLLSSSFVIGGLALAFKKSSYDMYGPLGDCHTEDSTIRFRILLSSEFLYSKKIGLLYRRHNTNITSADNFYSLKTNNISKQYRTDLNLAYQKCLINNKQYGLEQNKIKWYIKERNLLEKSHYSKSVINKIGYHLYIRYVNFAFIIKAILIQVTRR